MLKNTIICFTLFFANTILIAQNNPDIKLNNTATKAKKKGYYQWTVFIESDSRTLDQIDYVEYLLDPTFSRPQVKSKDKYNNFGYTAVGWGEFTIKAKVVFKSPQKKPLYLAPHWLTLAGKTK